MNTKVFGAWGIVVAAAIAMSCASSKVTPSGGELGASPATPPAVTPTPQTPTPNAAGSALVFIRSSVQPPPPVANSSVRSKKELTAAAARQFGTVASRSSEHKFGATADDGGADAAPDDGGAAVAASEVPPQSPPTMVLSEITITRLSPVGRAAIPSDDAGAETYKMTYKDEALTFEGPQLVLVPGTRIHLSGTATDSQNGFKYTAKSDFTITEGLNVLTLRYVQDNRSEEFDVPFFSLLSIREGDNITRNETLHIAMTLALVGAHTGKTTATFTCREGAALADGVLMLDKKVVSVADTTEFVLGWEVKAPDADAFRCTFSAVYTDDKGGKYREILTFGPGIGNIDSVDVEFVHGPQTVSMALVALDDQEVNMGHLGSDVLAPEEELILSYVVRENRYEGIESELDVRLDITKCSALTPADTGAEAGVDHEKIEPSRHDNGAISLGRAHFWHLKFTKDAPVVGTCALRVVTTDNRNVSLTSHLRVPIIDPRSAIVVRLFASYDTIEAKWPRVGST